MTTSTIQALFIAMGFPPEELAINEPIDVKDLGFEILSLEKEKLTYKRILTLIKKKPAKAILVNSKAGKFFCTKEHKLFVKAGLMNDFAFIPTGEILKITSGNDFLCLSENLEPITTILQPQPFKIDVLDLEVERTNSYFSDGVLSHNTMFGDPSTTPGGEALKYYASVRLKLSSSSEKIKDDDENIIAGKSKIKVIKSKICPPWGETEVTMTYGKGIDYYDNLTEVLIDQEVIEKSASWLSIWGEKAQGKDAMAELLRSKPAEAALELKKLIAAKFPLSGDEED